MQFPGRLHLKWEMNDPQRKLICDKYNEMQDDKIVHINNEGTIDETVSKCIIAIYSYGIKYNKQ